MFNLEVQDVILSSGINKLLSVPFPSSTLGLIINSLVGSPTLILRLDLTKGLYFDVAEKICNFDRICIEQILWNLSSVTVRVTILFSSTPQRVARYKGWIGRPLRVWRVIVVVV